MRWDRKVSSGSYKTGVWENAELNCSLVKWNLLGVLPQTSLVAMEHITEFTDAPLVVDH